MTQPDFSMVIAVVSPTPPGHCGRCRGMAANSDSFLVAGRVGDDGRAEALQVVPVVEVGRPARRPCWILPAETGATTTA